MSKICPKCGMVNADDRVVCSNCGTVLPAVAQGPQGQPVPAPTQAYTAPNQPIPVPVPVPPYAPVQSMPKKRYGVLRTVSGILDVLAWISLIAGILGGLLGGFLGFGSMMRDNFGGGVFGGLLGLLGGAILGVIWFVLFKYSAELIHLAIDLEENTRRTADLLDKMQK
ncbi:MAG TPA: zinc ribbon domain-containing protein [Anaerolineaceae bacterium]|nr:zinc ribbon domain-containing protein [Anaerolineaceae bacterium]